MSLATNLSSDLWNAIYDAISRMGMPREITFGKVVKRNVAKKLIWLEEFGDVSIPLVSFTETFAYLDTQPTGNAADGQPISTRQALRQDTTQTHPQYQTKIVVPKVGQMVVVLNPRGTKRFPMCVGVIQSRDYWQGEP